MNSLEQINQAAQKKGPVCCAVAAPYDLATMEAIRDGVQTGMIAPVLFGDLGRILPLLEQCGLSQDQVELVGAAGQEVTASVDSVRSGKCLLLMKGSVATPQLLKACLDKERGLNTGRCCCHASVCEIPGFNRLLVVSDGGLNVLPTLEQKIDIVMNVIELCHGIGLAEPKVALLASVEEVSPRNPATIDAAIITQMNRRGQIKGGIVDGPLAIDNIVSEESARKKGIQSEVAGQADAIVVPNIETANTFCKGLTYFAGSVNASIVIGMSVPIILPSRAGKSVGKSASLALGVLLAE